MVNNSEYILCAKSMETGNMNDKHGRRHFDMSIATSNFLNIWKSFELRILVLQGIVSSFHSLTTALDYYTLLEVTICLEFLLIFSPVLINLHLKI